MKRCLEIGNSALVQITIISPSRLSNNVMLPPIRLLPSISGTVWYGILRASYVALNACLYRPADKASGRSRFDRNHRIRIAGLNL